MKVIRHKLWKVASAKTQAALDETQATTAGAAAGGIVASTAGAKSAMLLLERQLAPLHEFNWRVAF
ncbi:MAG: hypothetical protein FD144_4040 [Rhodospirillaceae bacterium]|nr:MAG: hypothetical protein FD144_4040 [Rhodospirillaceae bacterium]